MFIQVIQGTVKDADLLRRQEERWQAEVKPGVKGYLGSTGGITPEGRMFRIARFESEEDARANSERAEQSAWWNETEKAFGDDVSFADCRDVDTMFGGGSNDAGFVQIVQGTAKDKAEMRGSRPEILGILVAWHGDTNDFTQAVYFKSEAEARKQEQATGNDELRQRFMDLFAGPPSFYDLTAPDLD
jgi:hypothetical protein